MTESSPVKVFIGSGEASRLERKVLIYSLRKRTQRDLDICVFNGTHNTLEINDEPPILSPLPFYIKYLHVTEFSLYRFLIPQLCNHQGKAIYMDSDIVCLADIGELFDTDLNGHDFLTKTEAHAHKGSNLWGLSVMLFDCERCRFDLELFYQEMTDGIYDYKDLTFMSPKFLGHHPYRIGELDPRWNVFDYADKDTKMVHYTNLYAQPWKYPDHPYGELWFSHLRDAMDAGYVTQKDIELSLKRSYVRRDIMLGNSPASNQPNYAKQLLRRAKKSVKKLVKNR